MCDDDGDGGAEMLRCRDNAFRTKALEGYAERVEEHVDRCVETVKNYRKKGELEINVQKLFGEMAFDV